MVLAAKKEFPGPAPKEAIAYIKNKGWKVGFDYRDVWREEHAVGFTVAKAMQMDVLEAVRTEVERAIEEGITLRQFQKTLTPRLQELGWWGKKQMLDTLTGQVREVQLGSPRRLRTIYNVNCRTARAAGQWQRIERTKKGLPFLLFQIGSSRKHRPQHLAWNGTLLSVDDPWWDTHMPPMGYGCKCHVRQVGAAEKRSLEEDGIQDPSAPAEIDPATGLPTGRIERRMMPVRTTAPPIRRRPWVNKRTGETLMVPEGIDPGFDSNPGKARLRNVAQMLAGKLNAADSVVAQTAMRDIVGSPAFTVIAKNEDSPLFQAAIRILGRDKVEAILAEAKQ